MGDGHERGGARRRVRWNDAPATAVLIVVCVVAFGGTLGLCTARLGARVLLRAAWSLDVCRDTLVDLGGLAVAHVWLDGSGWRVLSAGLLHGSVIHLILNIWSLWVVGSWAEHAWGSRRLVLLFAATSVVGCIASLSWAEAPLIIGASAGIMGIAGALLVARVAAVGRLAVVLRPLSPRGMSIAIGLLVGLGFVVPVIAQAGHLGGLAAGVLFGWIWSGRRGAVLGWAALAGLVAGLGWTAAHPTWRVAHSEILGFELLLRGEDEAGAEALERVLASRPEDAALANAVAYAYAEAGVKLDRAERLVRQALAADPDAADYVDTLGWILCRRGDAEAGMELLERASALSGGSEPEIEGHLTACASAAVP